MARDHSGELQDALCTAAWHADRLHDALSSFGRDGRAHAMFQQGATLTIADEDLEFAKVLAEGMACNGEAGRAWLFEGDPPDKIKLVQLQPGVGADPVLWRAEFWLERAELHSRSVLAGLETVLILLAAGAGTPADGEVWKGVEAWSARQAVRFEDWREVAEYEHARHRDWLAELRSGSDSAGRFASWRAAAADQGIDVMKLWHELREATVQLAAARQVNPGSRGSTPAGPSSDATSNADDPEWRPASWFGKELGKLCKDAARPERKFKKVRSIGEGREVMYSAADAWQHWHAKMVAQAETRAQEAEFARTKRPKPRPPR